MSHFLIEGLRGKAVTRRNEFTWNRLAAYVIEEVEYDQGKIAGANDRIQHPDAVGNSNSVVLGKWRKRFTSPSTGMQFALIPKGTFLMGSPKQEKGRRGGEFSKLWDLQHKVTLSKEYFAWGFLRSLKANGKR